MLITVGTQEYCTLYFSQLYLTCFESLEIVGLGPLKVLEISLNGTLKKLCEP